MYRQMHTTKCWKSQAFMSWVAVRERTPRLFFAAAASAAELDRCDECLPPLPKPMPCESPPACAFAFGFGFGWRAEEATGAPTQPTPTDEAPERSPQAAGDDAMPNDSDTFTFDRELGTGSARNPFASACCCCCCCCAIAVAASPIGILYSL